MGPIASAIAIGFLEAVRWLLWIAAALLVVLIVVQALRGDAGASPLANAIAALAMAAGGWACRWAAAWILRIAGR